MGVAGDATRIEECTDTYYCMVSQVRTPLRGFAPSYFDDIFVLSRAKGNLSDINFIFGT